MNYSSSKHSFKTRVFPIGPAVLFREDDPGRIYLLTDYEVPLPDNSVALTARRGFRFDGASIPRFFWRLFGHPYQMPLLPCALAHDALYATQLLPRADCDNAFLYLMRHSEIGLLKRYAVWLGVRLFGWLVWQRRSEKRIHGARIFCRLSSLAPAPDTSLSLDK